MKGFFANLSLNIELILRNENISQYEFFISKKKSCPLSAESYAGCFVPQQKQDGGTGLGQAMYTMHVKHLLKSNCGPVPGSGCQGHAKLITSHECLPFLLLVSQHPAKMKGTWIINSTAKFSHS